jgi:2-keto-4-pentenoate hydratase/2-oxohepta-3-ene-1,7-dioic acid hydratase in catechol pathway
VRFATFDHLGSPTLGIVHSGRWIEPIPTDRGQPTSMLDLIRNQATWASYLEDLSEISTPQSRPIDSVRLLAPLSDPGKIVAIGLNYLDHAAESQQALPAEPLVFTKFSSSIVGPGAAIMWDRALTEEVDFEAELAVVIGRQARNVTRDDALSHVFGYTCLNDVSARDLQFRDGQWVRGKSLDTFCPMGPVIVTADEIDDPQGLEIGCRLGDETMQRSNTGDMIFGVAELIARLSRSFTLEPGDVIATGTPPGVGYFREPRRLLQDGDQVTVWVERIGALTNPVATRSSRTSGG